MLAISLIKEVILCVFIFCAVYNLGTFILSLSLAGSIVNIMTMLISTALVVGNVYLFYINTSTYCKTTIFSGREEIIFKTDFSELLHFKPSLYFYIGWLWLLHDFADNYIFNIYYFVLQHSKSLHIYTRWFIWYNRENAV